VKNAPERYLKWGTIRIAHAQLIFAELKHFLAESLYLLAAPFFGLLH
jgi:hypothetical protein